MERRSRQAALLDALAEDPMVLHSTTWPRQTQVHLKHARLAALKAACRTNDTRCLKSFLERAPYCQLIGTVPINDGDDDDVLVSDDEDVDEDVDADFADEVVDTAAAGGSAAAVRMLVAAGCRVASVDAVRLALRGGHSEACAELLEARCPCGMLDAPLVLQLCRDVVPLCTGTAAGAAGAAGAARVVDSVGLEHSMDDAALGLHALSASGGRVRSLDLRVGSGCSAIDTPLTAAGEQRLRSWPRMPLQRLHVLCDLFETQDRDAAPDFIGGFVAPAIREGKLDELRVLVVDQAGACPTLEPLADALKSRQCPQLEELDVTASGDVSAVGLLSAVLGGACPCLRKLYLGHTRLGQQGAEALALLVDAGSARGLETLCIGGTNIGDAGCMALGGAFSTPHACRELQELDLSWNGIGSPGGDALHYAISRGGLPSLWFLNLNGNGLGDASGARVIGAAGRPDGCPRLEALRLRATNIGTQALRALEVAASRGGFGALQVLHLEDNELGEEGACCLARTLASGRLQRLRTLNLRHNAVGPIGAAALASALREGERPRLEALLLGGNEIGDGGFEAVADAIDKGCLRGLRELDLSQNAASDVGARRLLRALARGGCPRLRRLSVTGSAVLPMDPQTRAALDAAICGCPRLAKLEMRRFDEHGSVYFPRPRTCVQA